MKTCVALLLISLLLTGCAGEATFETIADELVQAAAAPARQVIVNLPEEAAVPASESETGQLYLCNGYEILVQTLSAGDLDATLREITGFGREDLTLMQTEQDGIRRCDLVWTCLGESGHRVGRAAILDDGSYHYVLSFLGDAQRAQEWETVCSELFAGYALG